MGMRARLNKSYPDHQSAFLPTAITAALFGRAGAALQCISHVWARQCDANCMT